MLGQPLGVPGALLLGDDAGESQGNGEVIYPYVGAAAQGAVPFGMLVDAEYRYEAIGVAETLAAAADRYGR